MGVVEAVSSATSGPVMLQGMIEDVRIVVSERSLTDPEWEEQVRIALEWATQTRAVLVVTEGPGLTSKQRSMYAKHAILLAQPTAILSSSALVRGVVTAMSWLGGNTRAFAPQRADLAFDFLEVAPALRTRILREIEGLQGKLKESRPSGVTRVR